MSFMSRQYQHKIAVEIDSCGKIIELNRIYGEIGHGHVWLPAICCFSQIVLLGFDFLTHLHIPWLYDWWSNKRFDDFQKGFKSIWSPFHAPTAQVDKKNQDHLQPGINLLFLTLTNINWFTVDENRKQKTISFPWRWGAEHRPITWSLWEYWESGVRWWRGRCPQ